MVTYLVVQRDGLGNLWFFILGQHGATGRPMTGPESAALVAAARKMAEGMQHADARRLLEAASKFDTDERLGWSIEPEEVVVVAARHAADHRPVGRGKPRAGRPWQVWDVDGKKGRGFEPMPPADVVVLVEGFVRAHASSAEP